MERNEKRGREDGDEDSSEEFSGERRVRRRVDEAKGSLDRNREGLHRLLQESARITEDIVAGMEEKTEELYDALEKKTEELNSKNDLLEVNVAVMRNMTNTHQSRLKQMSEKVVEAEKKVETMAAFEKCLISTMLNPDLEEAVKVVKLQQGKILELERKLEEKRKAEESEEKQSNPGESLLKLRGINISLVKEMPKTQEGLLERQSGQNSKPISQGQREDSDIENEASEDSAEEEEEGEEKKPEELVKLTFGKADLVKPTLVNIRKCGEDEGKEEGEPEQGHREKLRPSTAEDKQPRPQRSILQGLLRANSGLTVQTPGGSKCKIQQVLTPGGTSRSTATRVIPHGNQDDENDVDEEEDVGEDTDDGDQAEGEDPGVEEELGYIEAEKRRRRMKRLEEEKQSEESKLKQDAFWYSGPNTPSPSPPTVKSNFMSKLDLGKVGLVEEDKLRQELLEECLDCFRGWVHECLEDVFRV